MKKYFKIMMIGFLLFSLVFQFVLFFLASDFTNSYENGMSMKGVNILIVMADGFAEEELTAVKTNLQNWRSLVTIAGLNVEIASLNGTLILSDILIADIINISIYDAIYIPGGNHVHALIANSMIIQLLQDANSNKLVIAGIDEGIFVLAEAGLITNKKYTVHQFLVGNLTDSGGIYVEGVNVLKDENIITAKSPNYNELSYSIANELGYSYYLETKIQIAKGENGWNYSISIKPNDKFIVDKISINISIIEGIQKSFVKSINLIKESDSFYYNNLGILPNGEYIIDACIISIYGNTEIRTDIHKFSVGGN